MTMPIIRLPGDGSGGPIGVGMPGNRSEVLIKLTASDGANIGITEYTAPAGYAPPPVLHRHTREDAGFYVLEGELGFAFVDGDSATAGPGSLIWLPKATWFRWWVSGDGPARFLGLFQPAGFEQFFVETDRAVREVLTGNSADRKQIGAVLEEVREKFGDERYAASDPSPVPD